MAEDVKFSVTIETRKGVLDSSSMWVDRRHNRLPSVSFSASDPVLSPLLDEKGRFAIIVADKFEYQLPISPILSEALANCKN